MDIINIDGVTIEEVVKNSIQKIKLALSEKCSKGKFLWNNVLIRFAFQEAFDEYYNFSNSTMMIDKKTGKNIEFIIHYFDKDNTMGILDVKANRGKIPGNYWSTLNNIRNKERKISKEALNTIGSSLDDFIQWETYFSIDSARLIRNTQYKLSSKSGVKIRLDFSGITINTACKTEIRITSPWGLNNVINRLSELFDEPSRNIIREKISEVLNIDKSIIYIDTRSSKDIEISVFDSEGVSKTVSGCFKYSPVEFLTQITSFLTSKDYCIIKLNTAIMLVNVMSVIEKVKKENEKYCIKFENRRSFLIPNDQIDELFRRYAELTNEETSDSLRLLVEMGI